MNLQQLAVESVSRRGFHDAANIPVSARNLYQMEYLLDKAANLGQFARSQRKNGSVPAMPSTVPHTMRDGLLMAQCLRHIEENGELMDAIAQGNPQSIRSEIADVFITLSNIAFCCDVDIEDAVREKMTADELRGYLHGERVTPVTEVA